VLAGISSKSVVTLYFYVGSFEFFVPRRSRRLCLDPDWPKERRGTEYAEATQRLNPHPATIIPIPPS
jgi:hypothetical protein